jgi:hypothetical protein
MELVASPTGGVSQVDPKAFASSGAATKALGEAAVQYGKQKNLGEATKDLEALIGMARQVTPADVDEHAKKAGIFRVVGGGKS